MQDLAQLPRKDGFRLRGTEITRLETFTDAAFAFAVTMLVIAGGKVPGSFAALLDSLRDIPAFAASFAVIMLFWHGHVQWSRRYGLEDGPSIAISGFLILTVLVYVIPLRVLFGQMFAFLTGGRLGDPFPDQTPSRTAELFVVYGLGYVAMSVAMALLNLRALRRSDALRLDDYERFITRAAIGRWIVFGVPGVLSVLLAALAPVRIGIWSGFVYCVLAVLMPAFGAAVARRARAFGNAAR
jgi:uncharacterized membrane protein